MLDNGDGEQRNCTNREHCLTTGFTGRDKNLENVAEPESSINENACE